MIPAIAAELRIRYQLERVYRIQRSARFLRAPGKTIPPFPDVRDRGRRARERTRHPARAAPGAAVRGPVADRGRDRRHAAVPRRPAGGGPPGPAAGADRRRRAGRGPDRPGERARQRGAAASRARIGAPRDPRRARRGQRAPDAARRGRRVRARAARLRPHDRRRPDRLGAPGLARPDRDPARRAPGRGRADQRGRGRADQRGQHARRGDPRDPPRDRPRPRRRARAWTRCSGSRRRATPPRSSWSAAQVATSWKGFCRSGAPQPEIAVPLDQPGLVPRASQSNATARATATDLGPIDQLLLVSLGGPVRRAGRGPDRDRRAGDVRDRDGDRGRRPRPRPPSRSRRRRAPRSPG